MKNTKNEIIKKSKEIIFIDGKRIIIRRLCDENHEINKDEVDDIWAWYETLEFMWWWRRCVKLLKSENNTMKKIEKDDRDDREGGETLEGYWSRSR